MPASRSLYNDCAAALKAAAAPVDIAVAVANCFKRENPRFDLLRFMEAACGSCWEGYRIVGGFSGPEQLAPTPPAFEVVADFEVAIVPDDDDDDDEPAEQVAIRRRMERETY